MYAAVFSEHGKPDVLRWQSIPDPIPFHDEVVIEVRACGVNRLDLDSRSGTAPFKFSLPHILGGEFAGTIAEIGTDVVGWSVGQAVTALPQYSCGRCTHCVRWRGDLCENYVMIGTHTPGAYGEFIRVPARTLIALDSEQQFVTAASAMIAVSTAWSMVTKLAAIKPDETVLVPSASGGVATALVQCAKLSGARVIASASNARKTERVQALGADDVFVQGDVAPLEAVREVTNGRGVDAVLDTTGGPMLGEYLACLRRDGRFVICGAHAGERVELDVLDVFVRGLRIVGFRMATPDDLMTALRLVLDGTITVPIDRTFLLSQASDAHTYLDRRKHLGKVVLVSGEGERFARA